jgi:hypothetical protein
MQEIVSKPSKRIILRGKFCGHLEDFFSGYSRELAECKVTECHIWKGQLFFVLNVFPEASTQRIVKALRQETDGIFETPLSWEIEDVYYNNQYALAPGYFAAKLGVKQERDLNVLRKQWLKKGEKQEEGNHKEYTVIKYTLNHLPILKNEVKALLEKVIPTSLWKMPQYQIMETSIGEDYFLIHVKAPDCDFDEALYNIECTTCKSIKKKFPSFMEDNYGDLKDFDLNYPCMWHDCKVVAGRLSDEELEEIHKEQRNHVKVTFEEVQSLNPPCRKW